MILEEIEKSKFAQINDKRYYFSDGIVSLPFSHLYLHEIVQFKRDKKQKIELFLQEEKQTYSDGKICCGKKHENFALYEDFATKTNILSPRLVKEKR